MVDAVVDTVEETSTRNVLGTRVRPVDWKLRSAGAAGYIGDRVPPNALKGAILRSPYPYARIEAIDTSEAERMPGVRAIITSKDFPEHSRYAMEFSFDRPPLAEDVVRFIGQEVAAVAADTVEQARAAAAAIHVQYRKLKAPLHMDQSLAPEAPQLHESAAIAWGSVPVHGSDEGQGGDGGEGGHGHDEAPPVAVDRDAEATARAPVRQKFEAHGNPTGAADPQPPLQPSKNIRRAFRRYWGHPEEGARNVSVSVSGRFSFPNQTHCCMETHRTLADWSGEDGRLHLWSSTASPLPLKQMLMMLFRLAPHDLVVHEVAVGGSFGAKLMITDHEALAAALSRKAVRPVYIELTREEEFETTRTRHPFDVNLTLGADTLGKLQTIEGSVRVDNGAYLHSGTSVMSASIIPLGVMYKATGLNIEARLVDTCKAPGGAMRGYGGPQTTFPREVLMDELAYKLGKDPLQFRIDNAYGSHTETLVSHVGTNGTKDCLQAVRIALKWDDEKQHPDHGRGRGVGVATGEHVSGAHAFPDANRCDGIIDLYADGRLRVRSGCSDAGTGQRTILAQVAAEELGVPFEKISVYTMDTDDTPWDMGAWSSRGTHYTAHGIGLTARRFAQRLAKLAGERLSSNDIRLEDGFARSAEGGEIPLGDLVALSNEALDGMLSHSETFYDKNVVMMTDDGRGEISATHNFAAHGALVEVDEKTGKVDVLDYVAATDSGAVLNPLNFEGQVSGASVMGLGVALAEELIFEQGKVVNPGFIHYAMPRAANVPNIRVINAGIPDEKGPYGAKGVGELGINPAGPAIANAVFDAVGVRIRSLPITPDKVIEALREKTGRKRRFHLWRRPDRWYIEAVRRMYPLGLFQLMHWWQERKPRPVTPPPAIKAIDAPVAVGDLTGKLGPDAAVLGGGTELHLRRRNNTFMPDRLVAVSRVDEMKQLSAGADGDIVVGAAVVLADFAEAVRVRVPSLAYAIGEIATPQVRNVATVAGNLAQAKRCWFFRNGFNCYKRRGADAPCYAVMGDHRFYHAAIDGHRCQAVTPSDLATVLVAMDARVTIAGPQGTREMPLEKFYTGPGETCLGEKDVLTRITIPAAAADRKAAFRKLNLWQGDFAIASAAVSADVDAAGCCTDVRICLGAVGPVPLRARATEKQLIGKKLTAETLREHLDKELEERGHPLARNAWKLDAVAGLAEHAVENLDRGDGKNG